METLFRFRYTAGSSRRDCRDVSVSTPVLRFAQKFRKNKTVGVDVLGMRYGPAAIISTERANRLARAHNGALYLVLGHVMAHELGHILLGEYPHSLSGIMRAQWSIRDWADMSRGWLLFTPEQRKLLTARSFSLQARMSR